MPDLDLLLPFFIASGIFACIPGPGMFYAATQTITRGHRAGWLAALGFHLGGYVHLLAAAFGLAIVLETVPALFVGVKLTGAAYLIWLGIRYFRGYQRSAAAHVNVASGSDGRAFRDSVIVEILNPKTALFYLAFLPQFVSGSAVLPIWAQILVLGTAVNAMFSITDVICIVLSGALTKRMSGSHRAKRWAQRIGGGVLIAFGIKLAASRQ
jgi:threonine/homoserine/homoserine lactone efflux protein